MEFVRKTPVYQKVSRSVPRSMGVNIIRVRWVDTNKGTEEAPNLRSRLVAMEFKTGTAHMDSSEMFSAMPPLEAMRMIVSHAATRDNGEVRQLMIVDIRRAYFNAPARRPVFVEIPAEDWEAGDEDKCAELLASLYGTRDAAKNWSEELRAFFLTLNAHVGKASPCTFLIQRNGKPIRVAVHGDDIACAGLPADVKWLRAKIEERFETKVQVLGTGHGETKVVKLPNRIITLCRA
jgi:hypothetical protein